MLSAGAASNAPSGTSMVPSSSELIDAVSHPTRRRILRTFVEDPLGCASAGELAERLEQPVAQVGYHLKTLARSEVVRLNPDRRGWSLDVEPDWLGLFLDIWPQVDDGTARGGGSAAARRRPPRDRWRR
jgi:DNA-binding transcriptional ArsR family regulator